MSEVVMSGIVVNGVTEVTNFEVTQSAEDGVKKKRTRMNNLSLQKKLELLADVDNVIGSRKEIAAKYGVPANTVSSIVRYRDKVEKASKIVYFQPGRKRMRQSNYTEIDKQLFVWVKRAQSKKEQVNSISLAEHANFLAVELGVHSFKANSGWVERFKKRHGIVYSKKSHNDRSTSELSNPGTSSSIKQDLNNRSNNNLSSSNGNNTGNDSASDAELELEVASIFKPTPVNKGAAQDWCKDSLPYILDEFQPSDVFCAHETDLFFRCLPDKMQTEMRTKGKGPKDKVTVLCGVNMTGIEKLPLLILGKLPVHDLSKTKNLPLEYVVEKAAVMTQTIFESWLGQVDEKFHEDGRKIALVLNSSPTHCALLLAHLKAIKLIILPPDTTELLQPCSQGIINSFKMHYRTRLVQKYLLHARNEINKGSFHCADTFKLSIINALYCMRTAWDQVERETIVSSFRHAGFFVKQDFPVVEESTQSHLNHLLERLGQLVPVETTPSAFVGIDKRLSQRLNLDLSSSNDKNSDTSDSVSAAEAMKAVEVLKKFSQQNPVGDAFLQAISSIECTVERFALEEASTTVPVPAVKQELDDGGVYNDNDNAVGGGSSSTSIGGSGGTGGSGGGTSIEGSGTGSGGTGIGGSGGTGIGGSGDTGIGGSGTSIEGSTTSIGDSSTSNGDKDSGSSSAVPYLVSGFKFI